MAGLKELKLRINSVKSTQKITKVMKMVAAAKLKKARKKAADSKPYAVANKKLINKIISAVPSNELPELLNGTGSDKKHILFVIASDKGLCGSYNVAIIKMVKQYLHNLKKNQTAKIICIGNKANNLLKSQYGHLIIKSIEKIDIRYDIAYQIVSEIISQHKFDKIKMFYTTFESSILQVPKQEQLMPFLHTEEQIRYEGQYEPDRNAVLQSLILTNIAAQLYRAMAEGQASEYMLRMVAMDNATRNSDEMIRKLTLHYNRSRQAAITRELIEIISGAEAV